MSHISSRVYRKILDEVESFFSASHLETEPDLIIKLKSSHGWFPVQALAKVKDIAKITTNVKIIAEALENSRTFELSSNKKRLRIRQVSEQDRQKSVLLYDMDTNATMPELIQFLQQYGAIATISVHRRVSDQQFAGKVLVGFERVEDCQRFMEDPTVRFKGKRVRRLDNVILDDLKK